MNTTFTDGPLSFPVSCSVFNGNTSLTMSLTTPTQTTIYTQGLFADNGGAVASNLNSILILPNSNDCDRRRLDEWRQAVRFDAADRFRHRLVVRQRRRAGEWKQRTMQGHDGDRAVDMIAQADRG